MKKRILDRKVHIIGLGVFILYLFICHFLWEFEWGNDPWFSLEITTNGIWDYIFTKYHTWTSHVVTEFFVYLLAHCPQNIWRLLDISAMITLAEGLGYIALRRGKEHYYPAIYVMLMTIPLSIYAEAGHGPTTINYIWPASSIIFSLCLLKKLNNGGKIHVIEFIIAAITAIFAVDDIPVACITFIISIMVFIHKLIADRHAKRKFDLRNLYVIFLGNISLFGLIFAVLCPGNSNRIAFEAMPWPRYQEMSLFTRISTGYLYAGGIFFLCCGNIFIMYFLIALFVTYGIIKREPMLVVLQAPAVFTLILRLYITYNDPTYLNYLIIEEFGTSTILMRGLYLLWFTLLWALVFLSICIVTRNIKERVHAIGLVFSALVGATVLGLFPSVLNNEYRSAITSIYCIVVAVVRMWSGFRDNFKSRPSYVTGRPQFPNQD